MASNKLGKEVLYKALRDSFERLFKEGLGAKITKTMVIDEASYPDGSSVGKTTLYRKTPSTGEYVHKDFLKELDDLIYAVKHPKRKNGSKKATQSEKVKKLQQKNKSLREENASLLAQFIELEESARVGNSSSNDRRIKLLERDLYIIASALNKRLCGEDRQISDLVESFEVKYSGSPRLSQAKEELANLERRLKKQQLRNFTEISN
ncbi:MAG: hypothetical protein K6L74_04785 [Neptuniibacter sp.]